MSYEMKGRYEVLRMLRNSVLACLAAYGLPDIPVLEFAQPLLQSEADAILLQLAGSTRVGWQHSSYRLEKKTDADKNADGEASDKTATDADDTDAAATDDDGEFVRYENWIDEQKWTITVVRRRTDAPVTAETVTAEDVAATLAAWFNGPGGIDSFRANDCANLFVQTSDFKPYKDDTALYRHTATLSLTLQVPKRARFLQPTAVPEFADAIGVV